MPYRRRPHLERRWPQSRLRDLFDEYRERYWPAQFVGWEVAVVGFSDQDTVVGQSFRSTRLIAVDPAAHRSGGTIRGTLLHEMCHAATPVPGHGREWLRQVEMLLEKEPRLRPRQLFGYPDELTALLQGRSSDHLRESSWWALANCDSAADLPNCLSVLARQVTLAAHRQRRRAEQQAREFAERRRQVRRWWIEHERDELRRLFAGWVVA